MRSFLRVASAIAGLYVTFRAGQFFLWAFTQGNTSLQNQALIWCVYAVLAWSIFWWASQTPS